MSTARLTIDLEALANNWRALDAKTQCETAAVVKANAYGHGLLEIVYYAFNELGIKRFGCASLGEAMKIRESLPTLQCELWVFSDSELDGEKFKEYYLDYNIIPVIHNLRDLKNILEDKKNSKLEVLELRKSLLKEQNSNREEKRERWIKRKIYTWRRSSWIEFSIPLLLLICGVIYILYQSEWNINNSITLFTELKSDIIISSCFSLLLFLWNVISLQTLLGKYRNHPNIGKYEERLKIPKELQELKK